MEAGPALEVIRIAENYRGVVGGLEMHRISEGRSMRLLCSLASVEGSGRLGGCSRGVCLRN